jgi:hypothetical protein
LRRLWAEGVHLLCHNCQNYMTLCVRIGKIDCLKAALNA